MNKEELEFIEIIQEDILAKNMELVKEHMNVFSVFCFNYGSHDDEKYKVSDEFIEAIVDILNRENLWKIEASYSFMMFFYNDWSRFTKNQKKRLVLVFENIFPNIVDTVSQQILIEVISEYEANEKSFKMLNKLKVTPNNERYRYLIAYGYQRLVENTKDNAIRVDAFRLLNSMTNDSLKNVQIEAMSAVQILSQEKHLESMIHSVLSKKEEQ